jgi:subtilisin-like proprotein convertase family protein
VDGVGDTTTGVTVDLGGITSVASPDLDVMLVSPTGQSLVLMSDAGWFDPVTAVHLTFDDSAAGSLPPFDTLTSGTYLPTDFEFDDGDLWMPAAPPESGATTLAAFDGDDPNGTWRLYIVDDGGSGTGWIDGGWCLSITSDAVAEATVTALTATPNPSSPDEDVTFTATVSSDGAPVTSGTVTFIEGATPLATDVPVDVTGRAEFTTNDLTLGRHLVTARFNGDGTHAASTRSVVHTVTTLAGERWCSSRPITVFDVGAAGPYPSTITVDGAGHAISEVTVQLGAVTHALPKDLEVMLVSPTGRNLVLLDDAGGRDPAVGVDLTFSDDADRVVTDEGRLTTGTFRPSGLSGTALLPAPAPPDSGASTLATFKGSDPNGVWRLFVADDRGDGSGWIAGGWCLGVAVDDQAPRAHPVVTPAPNAAGWHDRTVSVDWNWTDAGSGVDPAKCTNRTIFRGDGRRAVTASCQDRVGNRATATRIVRVDTTAPSISISSPIAPRYVMGAVVRADYACADRASGIANCTGSVRDGARIDTSTTGRHQFTVTALDRAGNSRHTSVPYTVITAPRCAGRTATIVGTPGIDVILGTLGPDVIAAGGGADAISGGGGRDTICAGAGADTVDGGGGDDRLDGGAGDDFCRGGPGTDQVSACEATLDIP